MNHVAQASGACCIAELLFCSPPAPSLVRGASRACGIPVAVSGVSPGALIQWFMESHANKNGISSSGAACGGGTRVKRDREWKAIQHQFTVNYRRSSLENQRGKSIWKQ
jgi:hypothetical protein